jgi:hypothetical protein
MADKSAGDQLPHVCASEMRGGFLGDQCEAGSKVCGRTAAPTVINPDPGRQFAMLGSGGDYSGGVQAV